MQPKAGGANGADCRHATYAGGSGVAVERRLPFHPGTSGQAAAGDPLNCSSSQSELATLPGYDPDLAKNRAAAPEIMARLGDGPDKPIAVKIAVRTSRPTATRRRSSSTN